MTIVTLLLHLGSESGHVKSLDPQISSARLLSGYLNFRCWRIKGRVRPQSAGNLFLAMKLDIP